MTLEFQARLQLAQARKAKRKAKAKRLKLRQSPKALTKKLDALVGADVRARGHCESGRESHSGPLQWAHGFSRRYHAVRWDLRNGFCLCAGCHMYFTHRPIEWDMRIRALMGDAIYNQLINRALVGGMPDRKALLTELQSRE